MAGRVVGEAAVADATCESGFCTPAHAFVWDADGTFIDLGTLGGTASVASAVTPEGRVAGSAFVAGGSFHAFITPAAESPVPPTSSPPATSTSPRFTG